ncbi:hypothetical protein EVAR_23164_1 [Eumeta japonica]|uniref:Retrovirus-related Pol polyprotein from type-1 retrotransposable element R1 3 n=1 Tax=Eumeta variegata TaxID=151549 RepID=A0A4C1VE52_EUMVA|nr:hypothetical protein EVAR_23164_1 [Eumeta japonica]
MGYNKRGRGLSHQEDSCGLRSVSAVGGKVASLEERQKRYAEGSTWEITKCFFPRAEQAYRVLKQIAMTSQVAPTLTGHGGFAQYLFRFKLQEDSPYCACDPSKIQDMLHVLEDCDMFHRERVALEAGIDVRISRRHFPEIMEDKVKIDKFLKFCGTVVKTCGKLNGK